MSLRAPKALMRTEMTGAAISAESTQAAMVQREGQLQWRAPKRTEVAACGCDVRLTRKFRPGGSSRQRVQGRRRRPAGVLLDPSATYSELQFGGTLPSAAPTPSSPLVGEGCEALANGVSLGEAG